MRALIVFGKKSAAGKALSSMCVAAGIEVKTLYPNLSSGSKLSRSEYQARFGDDIDFAAATLITAEIQQGFFRHKFFDLDSTLYCRLRNFAAEIDDAIVSFRPDVVIVHGFTLPAQIATAKALHKGVVPLFFETPIVPGGAFVLDHRAPYFIPGVNTPDTEWDNFPLSNTSLAEGQSYITKWRTERSTKTPGTESRNEVQRLNEFLRDRPPVLLFALQVISDMNVLMQLPPSFDGDYSLWVDTVLASIPKHWKVIVKKHPRTWFAPKLSNPNHFAADQIDIHRLFDRCDCVLTLASNVGMEAALAGIPSIVCGQPFYANKGITIDCEAKDHEGLKNISNLLNSASNHTPPPPSDALNIFAHRALLEYHFWPDDSDKLHTLLGKACDCLPNVGDIRRPFFDFWPERLRRYASLVNEYAELSLSRPTPKEIASHWLRRRQTAWTRSFRKRFPT